MAGRGIKHWGAKTWLGGTAALVAACAGGVTIGEAAITPMAAAPERSYWHHATADDASAPAFVPAASYTPPSEPAPMMAAAAYPDGIDDPLLDGRPILTRPIVHHHRRPAPETVSDGASVTEFTAGTLANDPATPTDAPVASED